MNKEKHIEEMARELCPLAADKECKDCAFEKRTITCNPKTYAKRSINAGYRKQRMGENITELHPVDEFVCSECGLIMRDCCRIEIDEDDDDEICYEFAFKYCPRCGVKMKGE